MTVCAREVLALTPRVMAHHEQGRECTRRIRGQLDLHAELRRIRGQLDLHAELRRMREQLDPGAELRR